ncbi:unnamed protein product, partial [Staurois parvus]
MLLPGPESLMGPWYGLTIAAVSIATLCHVHFQVSSHSCWFPFCHRLLGRLQASHRVLPGPQIWPWAPVTALVTLLLGPQCDTGFPVPTSPLLPALCHVPTLMRSPHTPAGFHFL